MDETPNVSKKMLSWKLLLFGVGVFLLFLFGFLFYERSQRIVWTDDAYLDGYQIQISADIEARITELLVDEGDFVKKGQLLCKLDESILLSKKYDASTRVSLLEKSVKLKKIEMEKQRDIYEVAKQEFIGQIIPYIDFDTIEKTYQYALMDFEVAKAALVNGKAKLGVIEELLRHTEILAPRDGAIAKRWVVAGDVAKIAEPLFSLSDVQNIWITANLEETKVAKLKNGDFVEIHIDAYPHRTFSGSVFVVRASAASQFSLIPPDNATGNFTKIVQRVPVKILLDMPKDPLYLYPGMSSEVKISLR